MSFPEDNRRILFAARRLTLDGTAGQIATAMRTAGIRCFLLKGPSLSDLYEGPRHYADIDLLVAPGSRSLAESVLESMGFALRHDDPHSRIWRREGLDVDLHTTIVGVRVGAERLWEVAASHAETISVGGAPVEVLDPPARTLHVVLHAAQHGLNEQKPREDLRRALARVPRETWDEAAALAVELEAQASFWAGLGLEPEGRELQAALQLEEGARRTETELRATTAPPTSVGLLRLAETKGMRAKTALVAREAFPSAFFLRTWSPLARRGPIGLAIAYVWRPVWILLQLGPALAAIMRARRAARR